MFKGILKYAIQNKVAYINIVSGKAPVMKDSSQQTVSQSMKAMTSEWLLDVMTALFPKETDKIEKQQPILGQLPIPGGKKVMLIAQPGSHPELSVYLLDHAEKECMQQWNQIQQQNNSTPPLESVTTSAQDAPPAPATATPETDNQNHMVPPPPPPEALTASHSSNTEPDLASPFGQVSSGNLETTPLSEASTSGEKIQIASQLENPESDTEKPTITPPTLEDTEVEANSSFRLPPHPASPESFDSSHSASSQETLDTPESLPPIPTSFSLDNPPQSQEESNETSDISAPPRNNLDWDPFGGKPLVQESFPSLDEENPSSLQLDLSSADKSFHNHTESNDEPENTSPPPLSFSMEPFHNSQDDSENHITQDDSFQIKPQNNDQTHSSQETSPASVQRPLHSSPIEQGSYHSTEHHNPTHLPPKPFLQQQYKKQVNPEEVFQEHLPGQTFSNPETEFIDNILKKMVDENASDLHLSNKMPPYFRISGALKPFRDAPLTPAELQQWLWPTIPKDSREQFQNTWDLDYAYALDGIGRFRFNLFRDYRGIGAVIRQIPAKIPTAQELNLPDSILQFCHLSKGLVLVTGPTGSGKSTTLAAMIHEINRTRHDHIITVEDPVEFVHTPQKCLINHREVGVHTNSFSRALKAALREDPDIVLVGEMRDLETVEMAIETAETGHLVFGTLHTTTAASTVDRVVNQFPGERQAQIRSMLSNSLAGVVSQVLCPTLEGKRAAAFEVLVQDTAVSNLIRESKIHMISGHMETQSGAGNILMDDSLMKLLQAQKISFDEAYRRANRPTRFKELAKTKGLA
ncbi:MAG: type IV pilus twitching motility protein PilT [Oligoflexales bacterium]